MLDAVPLCLWVAHDVACRRVTGNRYAEALLGAAGWPAAPAAAGTGAAPGRVRRHGQEVAPAGLPLPLVIGRGQPLLNDTLEVTAGDGREIVLRGNAVPLLDASRRVTGALAAYLDVTERRRVERELDHERELLQRIIDRIPVMIVTYRPDTRVLDVNREFERVTGWTGEEARRIDLMAACYPDPAYREEVRAYMQSLHEGWRDLSLMTSDGQVVPSSWSNIRLANDTHVGIGIDIRDRKRAEAEREALLASEQAARAEAERERLESDLFVELARAFGESLDLPTVLDRLATAARTLCGSEIVRIAVRAPDGDAMEFRKLVGSRLRAQGPVRLERSAGIGARVWATGRPFRTDDLRNDPRLPGEVEWHTREEGAVCELVVPIVVQGAVEGLIYLDNRSARPFTDRDEALALRLSVLAAGAVANALLFSREQSASRAKDEFLATLGHELRNPLAAVSNAVAVLGEIGWDRERSDALRQIITRQMRQLSHLLEDLLDVSRAVTGKLLLRKEPVDLAELVSRCVGPFVQAGGGAGPRVMLRTEPAWVDADPSRLEQVVSNLVENAVKYTPEGGRVDVEVGHEADGAVLRVRDTGVGISPDLLPRVFDPFTQERQTIDRSRGGLGLGLALVKRLVELHGGSVGASSAGPGRGSEFVVRLPLTSAPLRPAAASLADAPVGRLRVLLVEDHADTRRSLRLLLEQQGHGVEEASDGTEGLRELLSTRPDVALVDIGLPGLDGYALARAARSAHGATVPYLVAVSGYGQPADRRRALEAGFDAHLVKPVSGEDLRRALAAAVRGEPTSPDRSG